MRRPPAVERELPMTVIGALWRTKRANRAEARKMRDEAEDQQTDEFLAAIRGRHRGAPPRS
jgi:hypothetical protein